MTYYFFQEIGATETLTYGESGSKSSAIAASVDTGGNTIAPYSYQMFVFKSTMKVFNVPFTATGTMTNGCGQTKTQTVTGQARVSGVASFATGEVSKIVGPAVPVECNKPFSTPIDQQTKTNFCPNSGGPACADNALCVRYQPDRTGTCCDPTKLDPCCAVAKAQPSCSGYSPTSAMCPNSRGAFHPCCSGVSLKSSSLASATPKLLSAQIASGGTPVQTTTTLREQVTRSV